MATAQASGLKLENLEVSTGKHGPVGIGIANDVFKIVRRRRLCHRTSFYLAQNGYLSIPSWSNFGQKRPSTVKLDTRIRLLFRQRCQFEKKDAIQSRGPRLGGHLCCTARPDG